MAIIKTTYTKKITAAKASLRYIEHRPGQDGTKIKRTLFSKEGSVDRQQAYQNIDNAARAKRSTFYRIIINPDAKKEDSRRDLQLQEVTKQTMQTLEEQLNTSLQWVAAEHADHAPNRHIHILAVLPRKLQVQELESLRKIATAACLEQRQERDHDLLREQDKGEEAALERHL